MRLASVSFENFKSFKGPVELELNRINYLIGPNGAGKSNVLAGIDMISKIVQNSTIPSPNDGFDGAADAVMGFSFTVEMNGDERLLLLRKVGQYTEGEIDLSANKTFQFLKYDMAFANEQEIEQKIRLSNDQGELQIVQELSFVDGRWQFGRWDIAGVNLEVMRNLNLSTQQRSDGMNNREFLDLFDPDVSKLIVGLFASMILVGSYREFEGRVSAAENTGVSPTGRNLPNQINTMYDDRRETSIFESKISDLSLGEIVGVSVVMRAQDNVLRLQELGRERATSDNEISSGHRQSLILQHFWHRCKGSIVLMEEPELHLHAAAQKKLLEVVRDSSKTNQLLIATHSPIFENVSDTESTFLLSKQDGGTTVVPIRPSNVNLFKTSMGISQADVFGGDYLCCVEGKSEDIAIPALARSLGYETALPPWTLDMEGCGNVAHLGPLIRYFKMSGKKIFVLLDKDGRARRHVDKLNKVLSEDQWHFLEGNFEDLFPSTMLVEYSRQLARELGGEFELSAEDLDKARESRSATDLLKEAWKEHAPGDYPKVALAERLASLEPGEIPDAVAEVVHKVMKGLGVEPAAPR